MGGGNSLDNTLRVVQRSSPPSGCCSTSASTACANGFGHGAVHLWAEDGTLLATASQSTIVRAFDEFPVGTLPSAAADAPT